MVPYNTPRQLLSVFIKANLGVAAIMLPYTVMADTSQQYNIPAGTLDSVLNQFAVESGVEFYLNSSLSEELYTQGLTGDYQPEQALNILLANTGLDAQKQPDGVYYVSPSSDEMTLDAIQVRTHFEDAYQRDQEGEMAVYDADVATAYLGKEEIERFKGTTAADLFTGVSNVHSGESRNGGGSIDPNVRGVQGFGRVPVVIDGTEQAISVYNGYRGSSNRNYIDPNLIGSMKVYKGAQLSSDINTSTGGAVQVTTLQPQDIVPEGDEFGIEIITETSSNSVAPNKARLHTGKRWQDVPAYADIGGVPLYDDPELRFQTRDNKSNDPFNGEDIAYRLALAGITPKFEWLAAYAYRNRGNYYSGTNKDEFYSKPSSEGGENIIQGRNPYLEPEHMALVHRPGHEVPNTSSEMESVLVKGTFNFNDYYKLQFNARYTESIHGEILASRSDYRNTNGLPQWPLANAKMQAYSLKYRANPTNRFLDLSTNLWLTKTDSKSNTGYGFPNFVNRRSETPDTIINTSTVNRDESRYGFNFKNKMLLSSSLDLTVAGSYQKHELMPKEGLEYMINFYQGAVRAGEREEYNGSAKVEWRPLDSLILNAGVRYISYNSTDYYIENRVNAGDISSLKEYKKDGYHLSYQTLENYAAEEIAQNVANAEHEVRVTFSKSNITQEITRLKNLISQFPSQATENKASIKTKQQELANFDSLLASKIQQGTNAAQNQTTFIEEHSADWLVNSRNDLNLANNACKNAMQKDNYVKGSCTAKAIELKEVYNTDYKNSGSGWMPSLTATWLFNDNSRIYARYAETLRFPSLFESTSGFSGNPSASAPLQPERARLFETAYVHYFDNASAKITYFDQIIENVMDRDRDSFAFANLDSQRTSGIELNTHYDNTDYFADGSFAYNFRNEVCDKNTAAQLYAYDTIKKNTPSDETCVRGGFSKQSFLAAHAAPEYTANLLLGARFFNQDLEVGFRTNYVSGSHDEDVIKRTDVTTYDAYMKYKFTEKIAGELVGTNLSDVYYLEAGSVSGMPAPGRTIGVKLSGKF
ncbi:TonB-dependent receptor domain-containing protein [Vibrio splendidus]|uniref:TonB-dependent receptor n=1 Tax=Vibrio splendidus TaxID=29497 RepID=UPI000C8506C4|nr:TonB-dependent receptor [Vibrio splendidus]PMH71415.1 TonB-dependent receptor [Vibrio splendidus]PMJ31842.1 TonB-dependent receptor [Vibrio splendidus]